MMEEMNTLDNNEIRDIIDLLEAEWAVRCKWVYNLKYNSNGTVQRYKGRLVAKGFYHHLVWTTLRPFHLWRS